MQEAILALFGAFEVENGRVWKRYDFAAMEALHELMSRVGSLIREGAMSLCT
jgi:hypothetical protein